MISLADVKKIVESKQEFSGFICFEVRINKGNLYFKSLFTLQWWPLYRTYIAAPVILIEGQYFHSKITIDNVWHKAIRWYVRKNLGIKHLHHINVKDNSLRLYDLLGIQQV